MDTNPDKDKSPTLPDWQCELCNIAYVTAYELEEHTWSLIHHTNMEKVGRVKQTHECKLCRVVVGHNLHCYADHVNGRRHKLAVKNNAARVAERRRQKAARRKDREVSTCSANSKTACPDRQSSSEEAVLKKDSLTDKFKRILRYSNVSEKSSEEELEAKEVVSGDHQGQSKWKQNQHPPLRGHYRPAQDKGCGDRPSGNFHWKSQSAELENPYRRQGNFQHGRGGMRDDGAQWHWQGGQNLRGNWERGRWRGGHQRQRPHRFQHWGHNQGGQSEPSYSDQDFYIDREPWYGGANHWDTYRTTSNTSNTNLQGIPSENTSNNDSSSSQNKGHVSSSSQVDTSAAKLVSSSKDFQVPMRTDTLKLSEKASQIIESVLGRTGNNLPGTVLADSGGQNKSAISTTSKVSSSSKAQVSNDPSTTTNIETTVAVTVAASQSVASMKTSQRPALKDQGSSSDRGAKLLKRAERICAELREKRRMYRQMEKEADREKKAQETESLDSQIGFNSQEATSRTKGVLDSEGLLSTGSLHQADNERPHDLGKRTILSIRQFPRPHIPLVRPRRDTSSSVEDAPVTSDEGVGGGSRNNASRNKAARAPAIPVARLQPNKAGEGMDKDNLIKLVNAPRSRKERMQVAKMMQTHQRHMLRQAARPKLSLHSAGERQLQSSPDFDLLPSSSTLQLDELSEDVRMQIAALMDEEAETGEIIDLDTEESDQGGTLTLDELISEDEALAELVGAEPLAEPEEAEPVTQGAQDNGFVDLTESDALVEVSQDDIYMDLTTPEKLSSPNQRDNVRMEGGVQEADVWNLPGDVMDIATTTCDNSRKQIAGQADLSKDTHYIQLSRVTEKSPSMMPVNAARLSEFDQPTPSCSQGTNYATLTCSHDKLCSISIPELQQRPETVLVSDEGDSEERVTSYHQAPVIVIKPEVEVDLEIFRDQPTNSVITLDEPQSGPESVTESKNCECETEQSGAEGDIFECESLSHSRLEVGTKRRRPELISVSRSPDPIQKETEEKAKRRKVEEEQGKTKESVGEPKEVHLTDSEGTAVDMVLALSLEEEAIRGQIQDTDTTIETLQTLLQNTREQLRCHQQAREKLLREEETLRLRRLKILKGAVAERRNGTPSRLNQPAHSPVQQHRSPDLTQVSSLDNSQQDSNSDWDSSIAVEPLTDRAGDLEPCQDEADSTCESVGEMIRQKAQASNTDKHEQESSGIIEITPEAREPNNTNLLEPDTTVNYGEGSSERDMAEVQNPSPAGEVLHHGKVGDVFSGGDRDSWSRGGDSTRPDYTIRYMGTVETDCMDAALLNHLAQNFAGLNEPKYMIFREDDIQDEQGQRVVNRSETTGAAGQSEVEVQQEADSQKESNSMVALKTSQVKKGRNTKGCTETIKVNKKGQNNLHDSVQPDLLPDSPKSCFVRLERLAVDSIKSHSKFSDEESSKSEKITKETLQPPVSFRVPKSKSKKTSEFYPDPGAGVKKKLKAKRLRDQTRQQVVQGTDTSSESNVSSGNESDSSSSGPRRGLRKKPSSGRASTLIREYLHAESSSDVDLNDSIEAISQDDNPKESATTETPSRNAEPHTHEMGSNIQKLSSDQPQIGQGSLLQNETDVVTLGRSELSISSRAAATNKEEPPACISTLAPSGADVQGAAQAQASVDLSPQSQKFIGHTGAIHVLCIWDDFLFSGSEDHTARRFHLKTCNCLNVYVGHAKGIQCMVVVTPGGNRDPRVYTGSFDNTVHGYNMDSGEIEVKQKFAHRVHCFHECWGKLYIGLGNGNLTCLDIKTNVITETFECSKAAIRFIESAREGTRNLLCVASNDCSISIRDAHSSLLLRILEGHTKAPMHVQVFQHLVYSGAADKTVQVHNLNTGDHVKTLNHKGVVTSLCVDGKVLLTAGYEGLVRCFDLQTYELLQLYYGSGHGMIMKMVLYNNTIYTGNREGLVEGQFMDLTNRWKCQFGRCTMVFGLRSHLEHHVLNDHLLPNQEVVRCLWTDCTHSLSTQDNSQEAAEHLAQHLDGE